MAAAQRILETCEIPDVRYAMPYAELRRSVMGVGKEVGGGTTSLIIGASVAC